MAEAMNDDQIRKLIKQAEKEEEDKAWALKKTEYGDKFNAPKFYELESFWPNFWAWVQLAVIPIAFLIMLICQNQ